jgi:hypothetical protein
MRYGIKIISHASSLGLKPPPGRPLAASGPTYRMLGMGYRAYRGGRIAAHHLELGRAGYPGVAPVPAGDRPLFRPETGRPLSELAEVLLRGPGTLSPGERN